MHAGRPAAWMATLLAVVHAANPLDRSLVNCRARPSINLKMNLLDFEIAGNPKALGDCYRLHAGRPVRCMPDGPCLHSLRRPSAKSQALDAACLAETHSADGRCSQIYIPRARR